MSRAIDPSDYLQPLTTFETEPDDDDEYLELQGLLFGDADEPEGPADYPVPFKPGSEEKICELMRRFAAKKELWHEGDVNALGHWHKELESC